jgi:hypothetical protein
MNNQKLGMKEVLNENQESRARNQEMADSDRNKQSQVD